MTALVALVNSGPLAIFGRVDGEHVSLSCSLSGTCPPMFVRLPPITIADAAALGKKLIELTGGNHADCH